MKWIGVAASLLVASPLLGQGYGQSLAAGDGEVIVGEPLNTMTPGYVYVYRKDASGAWTEAQRLQASNSADGDRFGRSLALSGNHLLVGSTTLETIYVFEKDEGGSWTEIQTLQVADGAEGDFVGRLAAVDGDRVLMATWAHAELRGAVYVLHRDAATGSWSEEAKLMGSDIEPDDWFGMALAIDGDLASDRNAAKGPQYRRRVRVPARPLRRLDGDGEADGSRHAPEQPLRSVRGGPGRSGAHRRVDPSAGPRDRFRLHA